MNLTSTTQYWIWLQLCLGAGVNVEEIIAYFGSPKDIYFSGIGARREAGVFTAKQLQRLSNIPLDDANKVISDCHYAGCSIVTPDMDTYPDMLRNIKNYPLVLYVLGDINCLKDKMAISLVGTRKASSHGMNIASKMASSLVRAGVVVVSGGAMGIDGASHLGALSEKGTTVAVLGCGFLAKYRDAITNLRHEIIKKGAVITEYSPNTVALGRNFPIRNRIISALSYGTVVVEGAIGSGSLITVDLALDQGRDVFAVPGDAISSVHTGTVKLIREGAYPVFSAIDILSQYEFTHNDKINWDKAEKNLYYNNKKKVDFSQVEYNISRVHSKVEHIPDEIQNTVLENFAENENTIIKDKKDVHNFNLSDNAKIIFECFENEPIHVDDFCRKTNLPLNKVLSTLTELELLGIISIKSGKRYVLND